MKRKLIRASAIGLILASSVLLSLAQETVCRRLDADAAQRFLPDRVPLESEIIPVDAKVLAGLQFPDKSRLVVAALATSGFSSSLRRKFQFILVSETQIKLSRWTIPAGIVGIGLEPQPDALAPTITLILWDFTGEEIDRLTLNLDPAASAVKLALTPKGADKFELQFGKYVIPGVKK